MRIAITVCYYTLFLKLVKPDFAFHPWQTMLLMKWVAIRIAQALSQKPLVRSSWQEEAFQGKRRRTRAISFGVVYNPARS